jgi:hypothetical protein
LTAAKIRIMKLHRTREARPRSVKGNDKFVPKVAVASRKGLGKKMAKEQEQCEITIKRRVAAVPE